MNFGESLTIQSYRFPDKIAIEDDKKNITYRQLNKRVNSLVHGLLELGLRKGDIICHLQGKKIEHFELVYAIAKGGMIRVPLNPGAEKNEFFNIIRSFQPKALVYEAEFDLKVREIQKLIKCPYFIYIGNDKPSGTIAYEYLATKFSVAEPKIHIEEEDPFLVQATSGTTGMPKAALLSHGGVIRRALIRAMDLNNHSKGIYLGVTPLANTASLFYGLSQLYLGGTVILLNRFEPIEVLETIEKKKVTNTSMVPVMWERVLQIPNIKKYNICSLEFAVSYGAPMHQSTKEKFIRDFSPNLIETFGITETGPISNLYPQDQLKKIDCVGQPTMHTKIKIVADNGQLVPLGSEGEIVVQTPYLFMGYMNNPDATAKVFKDGWYFTGDIGRLDEDHYLYILGRSQDMIISGGYNIYAEEVEKVLATHPKVEEVAVIGVPDEKWGEAVKALIVLKPGNSSTEEEVIDFCKRNLPGYKKPQSVEFVPSLPHTGAGKIAKDQLREKYWAGLKRKVH